MTAGIHNFTYDEGEHWARRVRYEDSSGEWQIFDETWTAAMKIRPLVEDPEMVSLTTETGGITLNPDGYIDLEINIALGAAITSEGVYDLFVYPPGDAEPDKVIRGKFRYNRSVTREDSP